MEGAAKLKSCVCVCVYVCLSLPQPLLPLLGNARCGETTEPLKSPISSKRALLKSPTKAKGLLAPWVLASMSRSA